MSPRKYRSAGLLNNYTPLNGLIFASPCIAVGQFSINMPNHLISLGREYSTTFDSFLNSAVYSMDLTYFAVFINFTAVILTLTLEIEIATDFRGATMAFAGKILMAELRILCCKVYKVDHSSRRLMHLKSNANVPLESCHLQIRIAQSSALRSPESVRKVSQDTLSPESEGKSKSVSPEQ